MSNYGINIGVNVSGEGTIDKLFGKFKQLEKQVDQTKDKLEQLEARKRELKQQANALTAAWALLSTAAKNIVITSTAFIESQKKVTEEQKKTRKAARETKQALKAQTDAVIKQKQTNIDNAKSFAVQRESINETTSALRGHINAWNQLAKTYKGRGAAGTINTLYQSITKADFTANLRDLKQYVEGANQVAKSFELMAMPQRPGKESLTYSYGSSMQSLLGLDPGQTESGIKSYINVLENLRGQLDRTGKQYSDVTKRIRQMNDELNKKPVIPGPTGFTADQYGPRKALPGERPFTRMTAGNKQFQKGGMFYEPGGYQRRISGGLNSALIGGAFPALFGQGPGASIGGGLGGGLGGMLGGGLGFGLSLVGTQIGAQVDKLVGSLKKTGDALGDFSRDFSKLKESLGLVGTATGQLIDLMAEAEGKSAAFAFARKQLEGVVGVEGAAAMKEFSDDTRKAAEAFAKVGLRMQSFVAKLVNATGVLKAIGESPKDIQKALKEIGEDALADEKKLLETRVGILNLRAFSSGPMPTYEGNLPGEELVQGQPWDAKAIRDRLKEIKKESKEILNQSAITKQRAYVQDIMTKKLKEQNDIQNSIGYQAREELRIRQATAKYVKDYTDKLGKPPTPEEVEQFRQLVAAQGEMILGARLLRDAYADVTKELMRLNDKGWQIVQMSQILGSSFQESFKGIIKGTMSVQEAFANMFNRIADHFLDMAARMAAAQVQQGFLKMFSSFMGSGPMKDVSKFDPSSLSGAKWPTGDSSLNMSDIYKAAGGPVSGGSPYVVGEEGPELFVPGSSGNIVPNNQLGGSTNVVVNVDASGSSVEGDADAAQQIGDMLAAAIQAELLKEKRPGGLLA